jgi:glycosyltransferase involved in cell wall biosynthesis
MRDIKNADYRIANSHGTAQRVKKYCNVSVDTVISASVDKRFKTQSKEEISETISKINVKQPYLLSLGTLEPRKNLKVTINAYLELKKKGLLSEYSLIIAGGRGWKDTSIVAMTQIDPSIIHLGYVEDKFIPGLYGGAAMFVYPTLYEGYGLPVLEALKCGTKVVTTNIPEITEVGGNDRVVYVEPTREGVMGGILSIKDRVLKEFPNLPEHTWEDDGKALAKLFRSIV